MHKIGILTFHRCINYGSYWQARCLVEGVKALGVDAVLLEHRSARIDRSEWRCALQPALPVPSGRDERLRYARKIRKFFDSFATLPLSEPFDIDDPSTMQEYGTIIIGSDEVWNLKHPWYGGASIFYGAGLRANRIVSYAASFGSFSSRDRLTLSWQERLRQINQISVRDRNSHSILSEVLGLDARIVLDPCLQFPDVISRTIRPAAGDAPFVAVYGHSFPRWFQRHVRQWADEAGCRLVSIGYRNDWTDEQRLETGPEEFAEAISSATAVATNFFHGCVFSLLNAKPYICCLSDYRSNKIADLSRLLDAECHVAEEDTTYRDYARLLGSPLDPSIISRIEELRASSNRYLENVLS